MKARINHKGSLRMVRDRAIIMDANGKRVSHKSVVSGVYLIGDFYVGASIDVPVRINGHMFNAISDRHTNKMTGAYIKRTLDNNSHIHVRILSEDIYDERMIIDKLRKDGFPLTNSPIGTSFHHKLKNK